MESKLMEMFHRDLYIPLTTSNENKREGGAPIP